MSTAEWRIALASAVGTSHEGAGAPCQDRADCVLIDSAEGEVLVAVVCDGAGSATYADAGAEIAVRTCLAKVEEFFANGSSVTSINTSIAESWVEAVGQVLSETAVANGHQVRDYACTMLAAIVGNGGAAFIQIGDGAIVVSDGVEEGWSWVFWPQHGEFVNTTNFVISPNVRSLMEFGQSRARIDEIALFSDGIENLVLHLATKTVHGPFFDGMFGPVRKAEPGRSQRLSLSLQKYLSSPRVCEKTDDDKTLILATRRKSPINGDAA